MKYHDAKDAWSKNQHNMNFGIVKTLLIHRWDIVTEFFHLHHYLEDEHIEELLEKLDTTEAPQTYSVEDFLNGTTLKVPLLLSQTSSLPEQNFGRSYDYDITRTLTHCINEIHLFKKTVSVEEIQGLFNCSYQLKLVASNNMELAMFFNYIRKKGLVTANWQNVIASHGLILSSKSEIPLTAHNLSVALSNCTKERILFVEGKIEPYLRNLFRNKEI